MSENNSFIQKKSAVNAWNNRDAFNSNYINNFSGMKNEDVYQSCKHSTASCAEDGKSHVEVRIQHGSFKDQVASKNKREKTSHKIAESNVGVKIHDEFFEDQLTSKIKRETTLGKMDEFNNQPQLYTENAEHKPNVLSENTHFSNDINNFQVYQPCYVQLTQFSVIDTSEPASVHVQEDSKENKEFTRFNFLDSYSAITEPIQLSVPDATKGTTEEPTHFSIFGASKGATKPSHFDELGQKPKSIQLNVLEDSKEGLLVKPCNVQLTRFNALDTMSSILPHHHYTESMEFRTEDSRRKKGGTRPVSNMSTVLSKSNRKDCHLKTNKRGEDIMRSVSRSHAEDLGGHGESDSKDSEACDDTDDKCNDVHDNTVDDYSKKRGYIDNPDCDIPDNTRNEESKAFFDNCIKGIYVNNKTNKSSCDKDVTGSASHDTTCNAYIIEDSDSDRVNDDSDVDYVPSDIDYRSSVTESNDVSDCPKEGHVRNIKRKGQQARRGKCIKININLKTGTVTTEKSQEREKTQQSEIGFNKRNKPVSEDHGSEGNMDLLNKTQNYFDQFMIWKYDMRCLICNQVFQDKEEFEFHTFNMKHCVEIYRIDKKLCCPPCNYFSCDTEEDFLRHLIANDKHGDLGCVNVQKACNQSQSNDPIGKMNEIRHFACEQNKDINKEVSDSGDLGVNTSESSINKTAPTINILKIRRGSYPTINMKWPTVNDKSLKVRGGWCCKICNVIISSWTIYDGIRHLAESHSDVLKNYKGTSNNSHYRNTPKESKLVMEHDSEEENECDTHSCHYNDISQEPKQNDTIVSDEVEESDTKTCQNINKLMKSKQRRDSDSCSCDEYNEVQDVTVSDIRDSRFDDYSQTCGNNCIKDTRVDYIVVNSSSDELNDNCDVGHVPSDYDESIVVRKRKKESPETYSGSVLDSSKEVRVKKRKRKSQYKRRQKRININLKTDTVIKTKNKVIDRQREDTHQSDKSINKRTLPVCEDPKTVTNKYLHLKNYFNEFMFWKYNIRCLICKQVFQDREEFEFHTFNTKHCVEIYKVGQKFCCPPCNYFSCNTKADFLNHLVANDKHGNVGCVNVPKVCDRRQMKQPRIFSCEQNIEKGETGTDAGSPRVNMGEAGHIGRYPTINMNMTETTINDNCLKIRGGWCCKICNVLINSWTIYDGIRHLVETHSYLLNNYKASRTNTDICHESNSCKEPKHLTRNDNHDKRNVSDTNACDYILIN